ncbi:44883_t:CDS:2, partial [Gigaspora margarita]
TIQDDDIQQESVGVMTQFQHVDNSELIINNFHVFNQLKTLHIFTTKKCSIEETSKENIQVLISDPIVIKHHERPATKCIKVSSESNMQHSRANNSTMSLSDPNLRMQSIEKLDTTFASRVPFEPINANELYKMNKDFLTESSTPAINSNNNKRNRILSEKVTNEPTSKRSKEDFKDEALQQLYQLHPNLNGQSVWFFSTLKKSAEVWIKALSSQCFFKDKKSTLATIFLKPNCNEMNIGQIIKDKSYSPYFKNIQIVILLSIKDTLTTMIYDDIELTGINLIEEEGFLCLAFFETNLKKELYIKKTIHGYWKSIKCTIFVNGLEVNDNFLKENGIRHKISTIDEIHLIV